MALLFIGAPDVAKSQDEAGSPDVVRAFVTVDSVSLRWESMIRVERLAADEFPEWDQRGSLSDSERTRLANEIKSRLSDAFLTKTQLSVSGPEGEDGALSFADGSLSARWVSLDPALGYVPIEGDPLLADPPPLLGISITAERSHVDSLEVTWAWFPSNQQRVIIELSAEDFQASRIVNSDTQSVSFTNLPPLSLTPLSPPSRVTYKETFLSKFQLALLTACLICLLLGFITVAKQRIVRGLIVIAIGLAFGLSFRLAKDEGEPLPPAQLDETVYANLRNIYRAFEFRRPAGIYDALAEAAEGPILERLFLEFESSLRAASNGGPRIRILDVDLRRADLLDTDDSRLRVSADWITVGSVTHWGHEHTRSNRYQAQLEYAEESGVWKLADFMVEEEKRLFQKATRRQLTESPDTP